MNWNSNRRLFGTLTVKTRLLSEAQIHGSFLPKSSARCVPERLTWWRASGLLNRSTARVTRRLPTARGPHVYSRLRLSSRGFHAIQLASPRFSQRPAGCRLHRSRHDPNGPAHVAIGRVTILPTPANRPGRSCAPRAGGWSFLSKSCRSRTAFSAAGVVLRCRIAGKECSNRPAVARPCRFRSPFPPRAACLSRRRRRNTIRPTTLPLPLPFALPLRRFHLGFRFRSHLRRRFLPCHGHP